MEKDGRCWVTWNPEKDREVYERRRRRRDLLVKGSGDDPPEPLIASRLEEADISRWLITRSATRAGMQNSTELLSRSRVAMLKAMYTMILIGTHHNVEDKHIEISEIEEAVGGLNVSEDEEKNDRFKADIIESFIDLDEDGSGTIDFEEFAVVMASMSPGRKYASLQDEMQSKGASSQIFRFLGMYRRQLLLEDIENAATVQQVQSSFLELFSLGDVRDQELEGEIFHKRKITVKRRCREVARSLQAGASLGCSEPNLKGFYEPSTSTSITPPKHATPVKPIGTNMIVKVKTVPCTMRIQKREAALLDLTPTSQNTLLNEAYQSLLSSGVSPRGRRRFVQMKPDAREAISQAFEANYLTMPKADDKNENTAEAVKEGGGPRRPVVPPPTRSTVSARKRRARHFPGSALQRPDREPVVLMQ